MVNSQGRFSRELRVLSVYKSWASCACGFVFRPFGASTIRKTPCFQGPRPVNGYSVTKQTQQGAWSTIPSMIPGGAVFVCPPGRYVFLENRCSRSGSPTELSFLWGKADCPNFRFSENGTVPFAAVSNAARASCPCITARMAVLPTNLQPSWVEGLKTCRPAVTINGLMDSNDQASQPPEPVGSSPPPNRPASLDAADKGGRPDSPGGKNRTASSDAQQSPPRNETPVEPVALPRADGNGNNKAVGIDGAPLPEAEEEPSLPDRLKTLLIGKPRDFKDQSIFKHISLVAFLAWVGLGADGLSSTSYGPAEAFRNLGDHRFLSVFLAVAIAATVFIISSCYSHIIEAFPSGGGGYLVASKLLGRRIGAVSGGALLVDYTLTITASVAAAGDALFGLMGPDWLNSEWKLYAEFAGIIVLIVLNLRGVKESIQILLPIFLIFLLTHFLLIVGVLSWNIFSVGEVGRKIAVEVTSTVQNPQLGFFWMLGVLMHAYSLGAGTYTGIEAVSNSMQVMREPRVATGQRTMRYMAWSLALTAGGLILAYLLLDIGTKGKEPLNLVLTNTFMHELGLDTHWTGGAFVWITLLSEGALLIVAAQAGFIGGPRLLANMAQDSWMPRWFANLSERLATHNGILLMGIAALGALWYTGGNILTLVIMYSINVFVTFTLSTIGMCRHWYARRHSHPLWRRRLALFIVGAVLCSTILVVTIVEKFDEGAWRTVVVTGCCVALCFAIHRYYVRVGSSLQHLNETLKQLPTSGEMNMAEPDPAEPAAVILVGDYSGLGIHTMLNAIRFAPDHFKSFLFISVGVIDSGNFKGGGAVEDLQAHCEESLQKYVDLGRRLGMPSTSFLTLDTDAVDGLEEACLEIVRRFPKATFFAGQLVFQKDTWLHRLLHNQTADLLATPPAMGRRADGDPADAGALGGGRRRLSKEIARMGKRFPDNLLRPLPINGRVTSHVPHRPSPARNPRQHRQRGPDLRGVGGETVAGSPVGFPPRRSPPPPRRPRLLAASRLGGGRRLVGVRTADARAAAVVLHKTREPVVYRRGILARRRAGLRQRIAGFARVAAGRQPGSLPSHPYGCRGPQPESSRQRRRSRLRGRAAMRLLSSSR